MRAIKTTGSLVSGGLQSKRQFRESRHERVTERRWIEERPSAFVINDRDLRKIAIEENAGVNSAKVYFIIDLPVEGFGRQLS